MNKISNILSIYNGIMEEIKTRFLTVNEIGRVDLNISDSARGEFYILQLRKVCELIALSCLLVHGDLDKVKKSFLQNEWDPRLILKALERLHPDFYPTPHNSSNVEGGIFLDDVTEDYLTKKDLVTLYGRAGDALHRGSLKKLLGRTQEAPFDIMDYAKKIERLLRTHKTSLINNKVHILCSWSSAQNGGKSFCALAQSPE